MSSIQEEIIDYSEVFGIPMYNQFHNILTFFDVLLNFPFTTSGTMGDYYLYTWYI